MKAKFTISTAIVLGLMLTSCSPKILYSEAVGFVDYSTYQDQGMFLTESNSVNFEYDAIGSVTVVVYSGNTVVSPTSRVEANDIYGDETTIQSKMKWKSASPEDALNAAVKQVSNKGGNGLINIKITPTTEIGTSRTSRSGFLVTEMAIKRK